MTRISTNVIALRSLANLRASYTDLGTALRRLSTGLRINEAGDDPAGLVISELLHDERACLGQAVENCQRVSNMVATAEGALNEVNVLLAQIRSLVVESASSGSLSREELDANQLVIDSAVSSINRIANSTSFGGTNLLDGHFEYTTSNVATSAIVDLELRSVLWGSAGYLDVNVVVSAPAELAVLQFVGPGLGASGASIEIAGDDGSQSLTFAGSASLSAMAFAVNGTSDATGVAALVSGGTLYFTSTGYGSDNYISIEPVHGTFDVQDALGNPADHALGVDAAGTVNGAAAVGRGTTLMLNSTDLDLALTVTDGFAGSTSFQVTGGGAVFQLGADPSASNQARLSIGSIAASSLGSGRFGYLSDIVTGGAAALSTGNFSTALGIVDAAIEQVSSLRGRLGAFLANTVEPGIEFLNVALENVAASQSSIRDADFAVETSNLARAQILVQAGVSVLSVANSVPDSVLQLLG